MGCDTPELYDLPQRRSHISDCWSKYDDDFATFYKRIEADIEAAKKVRGIKAKAGQPVKEETKGQGEAGISCSRDGSGA